MHVIKVEIKITAGMISKVKWVKEQEERETDSGNNASKL